MDGKDVAKKYIKIFEDNEITINKNSNKILNNKRKQAIDDFYKLGIPTTKEEDYQYVNLLPTFSAIYKSEFQPNKEIFQLKTQDIFKCNVPQLDTYVILFINGWLHSVDKEILNLDNGIKIGNIVQMPEELSDVFQAHYSKYANNEKNSLVALNNLFAQDGAFIYLPQNTHLDKPIQIINLLASKDPLFINKRNFIYLEENAKAKVIICDNTLSYSNFLNNKVTEIIVKKNADFELCNIQNQHDQSTLLSSTYFYQEENSTITNNTISLNGGLIRNYYHVDMNGEHSNHNLLGLYLTDQKQQIDNLSYIRHTKPNCTSNELFKGILDGTSLATFGGKIYVDKNSYNTKAFQKNNNIILNKGATAKSKPQLEIYTDEVKCSHGATIGQLDENALFYLQTRGINEKEAKILLMYSYANEVIKSITIDSLKENINELVRKRLYGELFTCNTCPIEYI